MDFSILEDAVLYAALERYCSYCESCLKNPGNVDQLVFIEGDLELAQRLQERIKQDYLAKGGPASRL